MISNTKYAKHDNMEQQNIYNLRDLRERKIYAKRINTIKGINRSAV